ncbi:hypothetical protein AXY43_23165 [Clostridium sp. MF28]|uniref:DUF6236 family protein n=1 Tax=Clostridium TaxID=1485 RepID=UPI000CF8782E|nr:MULTISPECIES: DUF6236 family protein [Clostridium]AVK50682.1 hypothetical protein AXY43_23165 [Clostridium sp. MF28]PSM58989.1 hypothetical protein C4L39_03785 [Clostridium diolis]
MRGIIVTSEYSGDKDNLTVCGGGINPTKLREYILYWDRIDYPTNNIIFNELTPDEEYLQKANLLKRTHNILNGKVSVNPEIFIQSQMNALKENSKNMDETWSIAQPTKDIILPSNDSVNTRNIQVELYDCIPIPSANISLEDILNFKEHRYDELMEFRILMDEMYLSIINSGDIQLSKDMCANRLQTKIIELNRVMAESKFKRMLGSVKVEVDIPQVSNLGMGALYGCFLGSKLNFPTAGTFLGLASSCIKVSLEKSLKPKELPEGLKDYAYLYYAHRELV